MNSSVREWDADTYDAVSDPQFSWGMEVLERLELRGDELALDAGCGSGRVSAELAKRLPGGHLIAVDGSEAMIAKARERLGDGVGERETSPSTPRRSPRSPGDRNSRRTSAR